MRNATRLLFHLLETGVLPGLARGQAVGTSRP
jgi:hypothetical protein